MITTTASEEAMSRIGRDCHSLTRFSAVLYLIAVFVWTGAVCAQTASTGALVGTVRDPSGAVVAGASVKVTNQMTGESRTLTTQGGGDFLVPLLLPGTYKVEVSGKGFKTLEQTGIQVFVTEKQDLHLTLNVGTPTEVVQVETAGELLKTEDAALGNVTEGQEVRELPLVNRNYTQIIGLSPGVVTDVNNASDLGRGNSGLNAADGGFSSHGGATNDNNYQMNGAQVNDLMAAGSFSGGVPIPNPDAIQEFKVQTGQYDASYGRNAGANVNLITKSGTNEIHGTAFEFVRNDIFNANDYFLNRAGQPRASLKQNQFGFTLGTPIVKNKLFFFGSYQGTRQINGLDSTAACLSTFNTPTQLAGLPNRSRTTLGAAFQGLVSPLTGEAILADGSNIAQQSINLLNLTLGGGNYLIPAPQNAATGQSSLTLNCTYNADQFVTDVDYVQSEKSKFSGRFFFDDGAQNATLPQGFAPMLKGFDQPINTSFRNLSLTHTYTFTPHLLNELVLAYNRLNNLLVQSEPQVQVQGQSGLVPFSYSAIGVNAQGLDNQFPGIGILGQFEVGGNGQGVSVIQNNYNLDDTVSYVRGRHSFRFGGNLSRQQINFEGFHFLGLTAFPDVADLLLGNVLISEDLVGQPDRAWRAWNAAAFAQDDIKLTTRLTVNLGLRYERQGVIGDAHGRSSIFDIARANPNPPAEGSVDGYVVASNFPGTPPPGVIRGSNDAAINGTGQNDWAPRVGFSWQLPNIDRVVLRGGYGVFYTRTTGQPFLQLLAAPPYGLIRTQIFVPFSDPFPPGQAQIPFFPAYSPTTALTPITFSADFRPPIVQEYSLNVQSEVRRDLVLEIGYEGSRGTHLLQFRAFNQALSASPSDPIRGETDNTLANIGQRVPIQGFLPSNAYIIESEGASWYNGLNVSLKKRFNHGLQFLASYTWARSLTADTAYSTGVNGGVLIGDQNNARSRYGPDGFIRPQRFVVSYLYELPGPVNKSSLKGRALSGWAVAGVTTIQAGQYMTITSDNFTNAFGINGPSQDRPQLAPGCSNQQLATSGSVTSRLNNFLNAACITSPPVITTDGGTAFGNIGVGAVRGPDQSNFDIVAIKNTRLTERFGLDFRAEFFNAFNTPQFQNPNNLSAGTAFSGAFIPDPTFGQITATSVNPRLIQFALKLIF
jgi:Carboxypeptidase regulatory-like domain/TonB dependent receptor